MCRHITQFDATMTSLQFASSVSELGVIEEPSGYMTAGNRMSPYESIVPQGVCMETAKNFVSVCT